MARSVNKVILIGNLGCGIGGIGVIHPHTPISGVSDLIP